MMLFCNLFINDRRILTDFL